MGEWETAIVQGGWPDQAANLIQKAIREAIEKGKQIAQRPKFGGAPKAREQFPEAGRRTAFGHKHETSRIILALNGAQRPRNPKPVSERNEDHHCVAQPVNVGRGLSLP